MLRNRAVLKDCDREQKRGKVKIKKAAELISKDKEQEYKENGQELGYDKYWRYLVNKGMAKNGFDDIRGSFRVVTFFYVWRDESEEQQYKVKPPLTGQEIQLLLKTIINGTHIS
jgi:hypothetical protein